MLRYQKGQFYREFTTRTPEYSAWGPRLYTFFMYLSDVDEGGATRFTKLNISVTPRKGSAILCRASTDDPWKTEERPRRSMWIGGSARGQLLDPHVRVPKDAAEWVRQRGLFPHNMIDANGKMKRKERMSARDNAHDRGYPGCTACPVAVRSRSVPGPSMFMCIVECIVTK